MIAASLVPPSPARAEFFTFEQLRNMCRGEVAQEVDGQFRTGAAYALLAQTHRERCRMYLFAYLEGRDSRDGDRRCIVEEMPESSAANVLADALLSRTEAPPGGATEVVREVLRDQFGCEQSPGSC